MPPLNFLAMDIKSFTPRKAAKNIKALALGTLSAFFIFAVGFAGLEIFNFQKYGYLESGWHDVNTQFDSELGWAPIPNRAVQTEWGPLSSNALGFRSGQIDPRKGQIAMVGDSVVWGYGVSDCETSSFYLNAKVANLGFQVQNLGVSGYGLSQFYLYLKRHMDAIPNLKHVVIVISTTLEWEDISMNTGYGKSRPLFRYRHGGLHLDQPRVPKYSARNLMSISTVIQRMEDGNRYAVPFFSFLAGEKRLSDEETRQVITELLKQIRGLLESRKVSWTLVLSPNVEDFDTEREEYQTLKGILQSEGLPFVDFLQCLKSEKIDPQNLYLDGEHYNAKGNHLLAKQIFRELKKSGTILRRPQNL